MLSGYYTIASGLLTRQREQEVIGNNLVNVQTAGYRADRLVISAFEQELLTRREGNRNTAMESARAATAAVADETVSLLHAGTVKETGRACDMAIDGTGFFQIEGADGAAYLTRSGAFELDEAGALILPGVGRVMGQNGAIVPGGEAFTVSAEGEVFGADGRYVDTLRLVVPAQGAAPEKLYNGMFRLPAGAQAQRADCTVRQNSLELSNVDLNGELTLLMESQRAFQACSSALQISDTLNRKATQIAAI